MGGKVGPERISGWIGKARLDDHLHIPKSERNPITPRERTGVESRKGKNRERKPGCYRHGVVSLDFRLQ